MNINHFNSHAHVERDLELFAVCKSFGISTHTLTWSVTVMLSVCHSCRKISTHTLTWSVTIPHRQQTHINHNFNSHAHVERDIHFPERCPNDFHFNSHAHVERDKYKSFTAKTKKDFNSHAHVERDT